MKIQGFSIKNYKRIKSVEMKPEGALIVIGGENGQGKSSILESFMATIGGKGQQCNLPVRDGEVKAEMAWTFDDLKAALIIKKNGERKLTLTNEQGVISQAQTYLDRLYNKQLFNPLKFLEETPKKQLETLKQLVGIDFTELDEEYNSLYEERTVTNRGVKEYTAKLDMTERHLGVPDEEVSVNDLMVELDAALANNTDIRNKKKSLEGKYSIQNEWQYEIERLEQRLEDDKQHIAAIQKEIIDAESFLDKMMPSDEDTIRQNINDCTDTNRKVRENKERFQLKVNLNNEQVLADDLTSRLERITTEKQRLLKEADFPVEGLSFDSEEIIFNGLPFSQESASGQRKVAVSMAFKLLKPPIGSEYINVVLIKDSPYLDDKSLAELECVANQNDGQILLEKGGTGSECQVIIEDGQIMETSF